MRGVRGRRWTRPVLAGAIALLLLLLALYAVDRAGGSVNAGEVYGAVATAIIAGAMMA